MIELEGHWWPWVVRRSAPENGVPQRVNVNKTSRSQNYAWNLGFLKASHLKYPGLRIYSIHLST